MLCKRVVTRLQRTLVTGLPDERGWPSASSCCRMASARPAEKRAAGALADRGGDGCMRQTVRPMVRIVSGKAETKISSYD